MAARGRPRHPLAGAARSHGCLARRGRRRTSARGARGLGRPAPGARGRRWVVGWRCVLPGGLHRRRTGAALDADDAHPADPADPRPGPGGRGGPSGDSARRRARALGARRAAILRRRGRAVHQRSDDRGRVPTSGWTSPRSSSGSSASGSPTAAGTARPRTGRCAPRSTRRSTCSTGCSSSSVRPGVPPRCRRPATAGRSTCSSAGCSAARAPARSSIRRFSSSRSRTTGVTTCCARSTTSVARARTRSPGWRRPSRSCGPSSSPTAGGCSTGSIRAASTSTSRAVSERPVAGTPCRALRVLDWWERGTPAAT